MCVCVCVEWWDGGMEQLFGAINGEEGDGDSRSDRRRLGPNFIQQEA